MTNHATTIRFNGPFQIEVERNVVLYNARSVKLDPTLMRLFLLLVDAQGRFLRKEDIFIALWPEIDERPKPKIIDVQICNLRRRLRTLGDQASDYVVTKWGYGYGFMLEPRPVSAALKESREDWKHDWKGRMINERFICQRLEKLCPLPVSIET